MPGLTGRTGPARKVQCETSYSPHSGQTLGINMSSSIQPLHPSNLCPVGILPILGIDHSNSRGQPVRHASSLPPCSPQKAADNHANCSPESEWQLNMSSRQVRKEEAEKESQHSWHERHVSTGSGMGYPPLAAGAAAPGDLLGLMVMDSWPLRNRPAFASR